jgi:hypothetical protein
MARWVMTSTAGISMRKEKSIFKNKDALQKAQVIMCMLQDTFRSRTGKVLVLFKTDGKSTLLRYYPLQHPQQEA